jgi:hypothetical protein
MLDQLLFAYKQENLNKRSCKINKSSIYFTNSLIHLEEYSYCLI